MSTLVCEPSSCDLNLQPGPENIADNNLPNPTYLAQGQVNLGQTTIQYTGEFPEERVYDGWASIQPGFGGYKRTSRALRHAMAEAGIATITYGPARDDDYNLWTRLTNSQEAHTRTLEAIAEAIPDNQVIRRTMPGGQDIDFDQQLLVPHSMGGLAAAPYAEKHPSKVDAIINLGSAGYGSPTLAQLAQTVPGGIGRAIWNELIPGLRSAEISIRPINVARVVHYYARNPARTIGEMVACLKTDVRPSAQKLGEQGVKSAFIAFEHDCLIPPNNSIADNVEHYRVMPDSGHLAPQLKAQQVAQTVMASLRELHIAS